MTALHSSARQCYCVDQTQVVHKIVGFDAAAVLPIGHGCPLYTAQLVTGIVLHVEALSHCSDGASHLEPMQVGWNLSQLVLGWKIWAINSSSFLTWIWCTASRMDSPMMP